VANSPAQPIPQDPLIGKVVASNFRVQEVIGIGAMGKVYKAEQISLGKVVALKVLHRHLLGDVNLAKRFHREAQAASRLNHRNSIAIVDFGQAEDGSLFIAMEYLSGRDLLRAIREDFPFAPERIAHILAQVCDALDEAHHQGIIHRDLKPENIMLTHLRNEQDVVKVCDFGIAKVTDPKSGGASLDGSLTMAGIVCGTPEYMSPEQARGEKLDARTDLYSLGVILYQMLTGELPFKAESALGVVTKHLTEQPVPPHVLKPALGISPALEALCLRAMTKTRDERPTTANEFRELLVEAVGGVLPPSVTRTTGNLAAQGRTATDERGLAMPRHHDSHPTGVGELGPLPPVRGRGTLVVAIVGAALLLVAGGAGAYFLSSGSNAEGRSSAGRDKSSKADDGERGKGDGERDGERGKAGGDDGERGKGVGGATAGARSDGEDRGTAATGTSEPHSAVESDHGTADARVDGSAAVAKTAGPDRTDKPDRPDKKDRRDKKDRADKKDKRTDTVAATGVPATSAPATTEPATGAPGVRTAKTAYDEGMTLFGKSNCTAAIPLFKEATTLSPGFADAYREMGKCYTRLGKLDTAIPLYKKYVALKPTAADAAAYKTIIKNHEDAAKKDGTGGGGGDGE
jgi:tRNA A-37 threonylcarbamoyl transferase component Bud32